MPPKKEDPKLLAELAALETIGPDERDAEACEAAVQDALLDIFSRIGAHVDGVAARAEVAGLAAAGLVAAGLDFVDLAFVPREDTSTEAFEEAAVNNWLPDDEPAPPPIDTWARGAVPSCRMKLPPPAEPPPAKAGAARAARTSATEPAETAGKDGAKDAGPPAKTGKRPLRAGASEVPTGTFREPRTPQSARPTLSEEDARREARLRDEIDGRKAVESIRRAQLEKDARDVSALATLQTELRGKEYGYDHRGAVVVLARPELDKLPPVAVGPRVTLRDPRAESESESESDRKKKAAAAGKRKPDAGGAKRRPAPPVEFIQLPANMTPSLADTMRVVPGVTLREGPAMRTGGKVPDNGLLSRREFLSQVAMQRSMDKFAAEFDAGAAGPAADGRGGDRSAAKDAEPEAEELDFNLTLASAPDWGANTTGGRPPVATLPLKSTEKQTRLAVGARRRLPRERHDSPTRLPPLELPARG